MKKISYIFLVVLFLTWSENVFGQKKLSPPVRKKLRIIERKIPATKIEAEVWKQFETKEFAIKVLFPKIPTVTKNSYFEGSVDVNSTVIQSYINQIYYMVEIREYPRNHLEKRNDLSTDFGEWFKNYILSENKVLMEGTSDFGIYKIVEFVYQQTENDLLIHRALVIEQKLYQQIMQIGLKKTDNIQKTIEKHKGKIDNFFESFEISENSILNRID